MTTRRRTAAALAAALVVLCPACTDPHSGDWGGAGAGGEQGASASAESSPTAEASPSGTSGASATAEPSQTSVGAGSQRGLTPLEEWLLAGFVAGGYPQASVRVHGSADAWVAGGVSESAPERFAHAWPRGKDDLYAAEGTVLRSTARAGTEVTVLQHVWGVSARFACGAASVDTYAQSQVEQNQAEAEALSLAEVLIGTLDCAGGGFQG